MDKFTIENCEQGREVRLVFDTDAENSYFGRDKDKGHYDVRIINPDKSTTDVPNHSMSLYNGTATLRIEISNAQIGDQVHMQVQTRDISRVDEPFINDAAITIVPYVERTGKPGERRNAPSKKEGDERLIPSGLTLPNVQWVPREEWGSHSFSKFSALKVVQADDGNDPTHRKFDFFINAENIYLQKELERAKGTEEILREQFKIGLVLVGLALIHEAGIEKDGNEVSELVSISTQAVAMMLIPMINYLGDLELKEVGVEMAA